MSNRKLTGIGGTFRIADAEPAQFGEIGAMTLAAFSRQFGTGDAEADLIEALRKAGDVITELVAFEDRQIVGHILFSRVTDEPFTGAFAGLAPMCARIGFQRKGIGSKLVQEGLARCRHRGIRAVIVLGDTDYYRRFGFSAEIVKEIGCVYASPYFQGLELAPGAFATTKRVSYAPAFSAMNGNS